MKKDINESLLVKWNGETSRELNISRTSMRCSCHFFFFFAYKYLKEVEES